jgi:hypothetical protein
VVKEVRCRLCVQEGAADLSGSWQQGISHGPWYVIQRYQDVKEQVERNISKEMSNNWDERNQFYINKN